MLRGSTNDEPRGDCAAALTLNPLLYESKYVIKNLLTLFVNDLDLFNIFIFNTYIYLKYNLYSIIYIIYYTTNIINGVRSFHPKTISSHIISSHIISPRVDFTPRSCHPTFISTHIHFTPCSFHHKFI